MPLSDLLPLIESIMNFCAIVSMVMAVYFVRNGNIRLHKYFMISAVSFSALFLSTYLYYHFNFPSKSYQGAWGYIYYPILISHIILAMTVPVYVALAVIKGLKGNVIGHKKVVKWGFPIWLYVSATGIFVYLMVA